MKVYLFDTMVLSTIILQKKLPEKWSNKWEEIKERITRLVLFESLIAELFYQLIKRKKEEIVREEILKIKGLPASIIVQIEDDISFQAGMFYHQFRVYRISLVDAFLLAVAKRKNGVIFTTDFNLRESAKKMNIGVSYLPEEEL